jgi:hypothetical protein
MITDVSIRLLYLIFDLFLNLSFAVQSSASTSS